MDSLLLFMFIKLLFIKLYPLTNRSFLYGFPSLHPDINMVTYVCSKHESSYYSYPYWKSYCSSDDAASNGKHDPKTYCPFPCSVRIKIVERIVSNIDISIERLWVHKGAKHRIFLHPSSCFNLIIPRTDMEQTSVPVVSVAP